MADDIRVHLGRDVLTTGQVAEAIGVGSRTAAKLIDSGRLKGWRIPGSRMRRVAREELVRFMAEHGIPASQLPSSEE